MLRRRSHLLLFLLLAGTCCVEGHAKESGGRAKESGEKKGRHARKAAARWARRQGDRTSDLVTTTGGMCHFLESEAFTGAHAVRLAHLAPWCVREWDNLGPDASHLLGCRDVHGAELYSLGDD